MKNQNNENITTEIRTILLIGRTGNGKSTITNVISGANEFKESEDGVSETRGIEIKRFRIESENIEYRIIDTIGIGDTRFNEREVLIKIAEAADAIKNGLNQILFVTSGRFAEQEIKAYRLLRKVIFAEDMGKYTTIIRTKFPSFRRSEKCKNDKEKMIAENEDVADVINSSKTLIHVNNLTEEEEPSLNSRKECQDILRTHLIINCKEIYRPKNLDDLNNRTRSHMDERERMEKEMNDIKEEKRKSEERYAEALKNFDEKAKKREEKMQEDFRNQLREADNRRIQENDKISKIMTEQMNSRLSSIEKREGEMVNRLSGTIDYLRDKLEEKDKDYKEAMERERAGLQSRIEKFEDPDCKIM